MSATGVTPLDKVLGDIQSGLENYERQAAAAYRSTESGIQAAKDYASNPEALSNDRPPSVAIQEQPIHVLMCYMLAAGKSRKEIGDATGYSAASLSQVMRQPWFRQRFLNLAKQAGMSEVESFVKSETMDSLGTLVEVRDSQASSPTARIAAANSILDRALGKPAVYVKTETDLNVTTAANTKEEIERQLEVVQQQLQARGIGIASRN